MARPATFYKANREVTSQLHSLVNSSSVPKHYKALIECVVEAQLKNDDRPITRPELITLLKQLPKAQAVGTSDASMTMRDKELISLGVMAESKSELDGKVINLKTFLNLNPLLEGQAQKDSTKTSPSEAKKNVATATPTQIKLALDEIEESYGVLTATDKMSSRVDALLTGVLDGMVRLSANDKRKEITGHYHFGQERVWIKTVTNSSDDSQIIMLSDYRVIRALNEMFVRYVEEKYGEIKRMTNQQKASITDDFVFDIYDLCEEMSLQRTKVCADNVREILRRLASTEFKMDATDAPLFKQKFLLGADSMNLRYITESRSYSEIDQDSDSLVVNFSARLYMVRFHSSILYGLLNDATRHIAHPALVQEKSGIAHRFNSWCKVVIGVRPGPRDKPRTFLLDELWELMMSSSRLDNFCRYFESLLARECVDGKDSWSIENKSRSLIYGYFVEIDSDTEVIKEQMRIKGRRRRRGGKLYPAVTIWRDAKDEIVGDNSAHNLALRRFAAEISQDEDIQALEFQE